MSHDEVAGAPVHLQFGARVGESDVEKALRRSAELFDHGRAGPRAVLDLAALEYADYFALARLAALIDGLLRRGGQCEIVLPHLELRDDEQRFLDSTDELEAEGRRDLVARHVQRRPAQRRRALEFLAGSGFLGSLMRNANGRQVQLRMAADGARDADFSLGWRLPASQRVVPRLLPLHLLSDSEGVAQLGDEWRDLASDVVSQGRRFLSTSASEAITDALFGELVENVTEHASFGLEGASPANAIAGAMVHANGLRQFGSRFRSGDRALDAYMSALAESGVPVTRLVVADSGVGIHSTLSNAYIRSGGDPRGKSIATDTIFYAFSPLGTRYAASASDKRLTRGLARVVRYVRENEGAITVRTGDALVGFCFPDRRENRIARRRLAPGPGTVVEVTLPLLQRRHRSRASRPAEFPRDAPELFPVYFSPTESADIRPAIARLVEDRRPNRVVAVMLPTTWEHRARAPEELAIQLGKVSLEFEGSCLVVLVVPQATRAEIAAGFQTVDDAREGADAQELSDVEIPAELGVFLVIPADGDYRFHGGDESIRGILYRATENGGEVTASDSREVSTILDLHRPGAPWLERSAGERAAVSPEVVHAFLNELARQELVGRVGG